MNLLKELDIKDIELLKKIKYEVEDRNLTDNEINDVIGELAKAETSNWDKDRNSTTLSTAFNELSLKILDSHKPLFFMKNKLKKYNIERKELLDKIELCKKRIKKIAK